MNLVIDIGNTRSKYAFFQEDRLIGVNYRLDSILEDIRVWKEKGEKVWIFLTGSGHIDSEMQLAIKRASRLLAGSFACFGGTVENRICYSRDLGIRPDRYLCRSKELLPGGLPSW